VYCQSTHSKPSPRFGASRLPWLTGTAAWAYYSTMYYILGIQPNYNGLKIDPCIPSQWKGFSAKRVFRNKVLDIKVLNEQGIQKGVKKMILNNETIEGNFIPFDKMKEENDVQVFMGTSKNL
jgi:cellobiose phosphorylase